MKIKEITAKIIKESFTDISVAKLGIGDIVKKADQELSGEAADAIDSFVGVPHNAMDKQMWGGVMYSRALEDAYGPTPSERGKQIRQQLEQAFQPVKELLKNKFGNSITLYRGQSSVDKGKPRHTLSWTSDPRIAAWFAGITPREMKWKPITDQEITDALKTYHATGEVKWRQNRYVRTDQKTDTLGKDDFYYAIYDRDGEFVTDGDDLEQQFRGDQEWYNELLAKRQKKLEKVISVTIPIDDIIWITDRAGQSEFILHNQPGKSGYVDTTGKLIK